MRDLNDAVSHNPYDEQVKRIVTAFAALLHGIVKAIERVASGAGCWYPSGEYRL